MVQADISLQLELRVMFAIEWPFYRVFPGVEKPFATVLDHSVGAVPGFYFRVCFSLVSHYVILSS